MAESGLNEHHLIAPRKLILLVRTTDKGVYQAVTLNGEVVISGGSRDEIKEKMRAQVKAMDSRVRPTTVRLHFLEEARTWIMAPAEDESHGKEKAATEKTGSDKSGSDKSGSDKTGSDKSGSDKAGEDKSARNKSSKK